jgi:hypothetical protein
VAVGLFSVVCEFCSVRVLLAPSLSEPQSIISHNRTVPNTTAPHLMHAGVDAEGVPRPQRRLELYVKVTQGHEDPLPLVVPDAGARGAQRAVTRVLAELAVFVVVDDVELVELGVADLGWRGAVAASWLDGWGNRCGTRLLPQLPGGLHSPPCACCGCRAAILARAATAMLRRRSCRLSRCRAAGAAGGGEKMAAPRAAMLPPPRPAAAEQAGLLQSCGAAYGPASVSSASHCCSHAEWSCDATSKLVCKV